MARRHITGSNDCIKPQPIKRNQAIIKPGFIDFQRGAGRFYLNPTLAGHPQGTEVSFWLATDNGPLQVFLAPQESVAFIPADQVPRAQHILQGEQGFRLTPLALKIFTASRCMAFTVAPIAS